MPFDACTVATRQTTRQETTLDSISELELFQAIVERGGISHAAVALHSSPAAVSRRLRQLETRLGVSLANRSTRRFDLTDEGRLLYERAAAILESVRDVESEVSSRGTVEMCIRDSVKGVAFERFLGRTFRGEIGQFFTPRTIVEFMVHMVDPQAVSYTHLDVYKRQALTS